MGDVEYRAYVDAEIGDELRLLRVPDDYWENKTALISTRRVEMVSAFSAIGERLFPRGTVEGRYVRLTAKAGAFPTKPSEQRGFRRQLDRVSALITGAEYHAEDEDEAQSRVMSWIPYWNNVRSVVPSDELRSRRRPSGQLVVRVLNVGQADCILLEMPDGERWLVDAGSNVVRPLKKLLPAEDLVIDRLFVTHAHRDHIAGIPSLVKAGMVRALYLPAGIEDSLHPALMDAVKVADPDNMDVVVLAPYQSEIENDDVKVRLHFDRSLDDENKRSLVMSIATDKVRLVLPGDYEAKSLTAEYVEAFGGKDDGSMVYKASHHGAENGPHSAILELAGSGMSLISCKRNKTFKHPRRQAMTAMAALGPVMRTDVCGTLSVSLPLDFEGLPKVEAANCNTKCRSQRQWCEQPPETECAHDCALTELCCAGCWQGADCTGN